MAFAGLLLLAMVLPAGEVRNLAVALPEAANRIAAFPGGGLVEHLFDHRCVKREAGDEGVDVTGVQAPCVSGHEVFDRAAILRRQ